VTVGALGVPGPLLVMVTESNVPTSAASIHDSGAGGACPASGLWNVIVGRCRGRVVPPLFKDNGHTTIRVRAQVLPDRKPVDSVDMSWT